ncbi:hypothetical protein Q5752_000298 [Cryptotrichosporon argae]
MSTPPRMLVLCSGTYEALVALPPTYDKAVQAAMEKLAVPKDTHVVRLSCKAADMAWIGVHAGSHDIFIADNDSYHYACAGKHVVRLDVHVFDKNPPKADAAPAKADSKKDEKKDDKKEEKKDDKKDDKKNGNKDDKKGGGGSAKAAVASASISYTVESTAGKTTEMTATLSAPDLAKGPAPGEYLGTLSVDASTFAQRFAGRQLGPNEVLTKFVVHDKNTARLLFRPRAVRPRVDMLFPEEQSMEVTLSVADWTVTTAYPMTALVPDGARQKLRWFLRVKPGGAVEDLLTGTEASGLFVEMVPAPKPRPATAVDPNGPLIPAWPDIRPLNAWCLPQTIFVPHIDRILQSLGLPAESRTAMITAWLPGITRHKHIAYRILSKDQLAPSSALTIIPPPQALIRVFVLFRGVPDAELKDWESRGVVHAEMGLDWRDAVGYTPAMADESLFRVVEYGAMEVFD